MPTILITGGTGLIGKALGTLLIQHGYEIIILTRDVHQANNHSKKNIQYAHWDVLKQTIDTDAIQKANYIIHLAGAGVAEKRWTDKRKKEIADSRIQSSALLIKALQQNPHQVKAVIAASAIGWYGADEDNLPADSFVETDIASSDFLGKTCLAWEQSIEPIAKMGIRLVKLRTGIVLSNDGGALAEFKKPLQFGIAAILSNGKQMISWIHIEDICRMYLEAIQNEKIEGVYNAVAPKPVSNKVLTLTLANAVRGNFYIALYIPSFILKAILGELSIEVLKSTHVSANKISKAGFDFMYASIESAVRGLIGKNK